MGGSSRRKRDDDGPSDDRKTRDRRSSRSVSPPDKRPRERERDVREKEKDKDAANDDVCESMSIEETNKMRVKLGLAPLETDDAPKIRDGEDGSKIITEDGMEFHHKKAENWADKKRDQDIRDKLEAARKKRQIYNKVVRAKNLADSDSDDEGAAGWVAKLRKQEEEKKQAAEREKMLNDMDDEFGVEGLIADKSAKSKSKQQQKNKRPKGADMGGLVIGHSKDAFVGMADQILVLEDKSVLDDGDETLINPNLLDNERHTKNVELRKRKDHHRNFDEDVDQFGNPKNFGVLAKYDEELEGVQKQTFRLDDSGSFDLQKEERESQVRRQLEMAGKTLVSLELPKYKVASEFYTQEEMIAFRKPKKVKKEKIRKRGKLLKADDLIPDEPSEQNLGSRNRGRRRQEDDEDAPEGEAMDTSDGASKKEPTDADNEDGEAPKKGWKKATGGTVDIAQLKQLANYNSDDEESEDDLMGGDLGGVIIDDDAEDELSSILDKARKIKQREVKSESDPAHAVQTMMSSHGGVKMEVDSDEEDSKQPAEGVVFLDSTTEYCRNIGENLTYGLAGNRTDAMDVSHLKEEEDAEAAAVAEIRAQQVERERQRKREKKEVSKGGWLKAGTSGDIDSDDERELEAAKERARERGDESVSDDSDDDEDNPRKKEYVNVLGKEADVTKGVGAMLKLAAEKGYLNDPNAARRTGQNLDHLKNQSKTQIEVAKYDIEDKYAKKLDRLGTTGRGPIVNFQEKKDYNPEVVLEYVDGKGHVMDSKDAYRELSYKFHGRNPGKKQTEKRMVQREKKEMLKQMNSSDTPLGTLTKQLKKQEQLSTPYLVLSGTGRNDQRVFTSKIHLVIKSCILFQHFDQKGLSCLSRKNKLNWIHFFVCKVRL